MKLKTLLNTAFRYETETEIAKRFDVSQTTVNTWRHGKSKPSYDQALMLRKFHFDLARRIVKREKLTEIEKSFLIDTIEETKKEIAESEALCNLISIDLMRRTTG